MVGKEDHSVVPLPEERGLTHSRVAPADDGSGLQQDTENRSCVRRVEGRRPVMVALFWGHRCAHAAATPGMSGARRRPTRMVAMNGPLLGELFAPAALQSPLFFSNDSKK